MQQVRILADSQAPSGARLTTWLLTYPRMIHSEVMTHREFSRCASSSRAVPPEKTIAEIVTDPAMPLFWGKAQKGMQAYHELDEADRFQAKSDWLFARDRAIESARNMLRLGLHKQIVNRILEPFSWITVVVSTTDHANLFHLRDKPDVMYEFRALVSEMRAKLLESKPRQLRAGEWHLPFYMADTDDDLSSEEVLKVCTGRVARTSFLTHDGKRDPGADIDLHDRLVKNGHWSPFEHCAKASNELVQSGNFKGFIQYRKLFQNEYKSSYRAQWFTADNVVRLQEERLIAIDKALYQADIALKAGIQDQAEAFLAVARANAKTFLGAEAA